MVEEQEKVIDQVEEHIVRALAYYDIFNYPLRTEEVFRFLGISNVTVSEVETKLNELVVRTQVFKFGDLYSIQNNIENVDRRLKGNSEANKLMSLAVKQANLIARFPFVRAVFGSGSLSKNYMDENSDLDFFIVTRPGRLWIARMMLVLYKKIFLGNSYKHFCINYFVDTEHLTIEEQNLFTATELATAIPLYGSDYYRKLHESNQWLNRFFPNFKPRPTAGVKESNIGLFKKILEGCFNLFFARRLDAFFMKVSHNRLKRIYGKDFADDDFNVAFKTKNYASKNHRNHYQRKVMVVYEEKLKGLALH